jgi:hypothetical protein
MKNKKYEKGLMMQKTGKWGMAVTQLFQKQHSYALQHTVSRNCFFI